QSPYDVAVRNVVFHPVTSPLRQGSYRALASTANHYAREMHMDTMARAVGIDAVEFRMRHLRDERIRAVLQAAANKIGWPKPSAAGRALGLACGTEKGGYVASAGAGEASLVCVAPAIGSAVRAFGTVDTALPIRLRHA